MPSTPEQRRRARARNRALGLCRCGQKARPNKTRCDRCIEADNASERRRKVRLAQSGLCPRCGKHKPAAGKRYCIVCIRWTQEHCRAKPRRPNTGWLVYSEWRMQGCVDCPTGTVWPIACIDAHHLHAKDNTVAWQRLSAAEVLSELDGCVPLCANHHRMRHALGWGHKNAEG